MQYFFYEKGLSFYWTFLNDLIAAYKPWHFILRNKKEQNNKLKPIL